MNVNLKAVPAWAGEGGEAGPAMVAIVPVAQGDSIATRPQQLAGFCRPIGKIMPNAGLTLSANGRLTGHR